MNVKGCLLAKSQTKKQCIILYFILYFVTHFVFYPMEQNIYQMIDEQRITHIQQNKNICKSHYVIRRNIKPLITKPNLTMEL